MQSSFVENGIINVSQVSHERKDVNHNILIHTCFNLHNNKITRNAVINNNHLSYHFLDIPDTLIIVLIILSTIFIKNFLDKPDKKQ